MMNDAGLRTKHAMWFWNVSRQTLWKWRAKGLPYDEDSKSYPMKAGNDWLRANIWEVRDEKGSIAEEKLRRERAKRIRDELIAMEMEGTMISKEEVAREFNWRLQFVRNELMNLHRTLVPALVTARDHRDMSCIIREKVLRIFREYGRKSAILKSAIGIKRGGDGNGTDRNTLKETEQEFKKGLPVIRQGEAFIRGK